jgi:hypothetical protein
MTSRQGTPSGPAGYTYLLSNADERRAVALAAELHARFEAMPGRFKNNPSTLRLAKLGEVGAACWLVSRRLKHTEMFSDPARHAESDMIVSGLRVEVRSWSAKHWNEMGRSVDPEQLPMLNRTIDVVLWATLDNASGSTQFEARGWSRLRDIETAPITVIGPPWNKTRVRQLNPHQLQPMSVLLTALEAKNQQAPERPPTVA